MPRNGLPRRMQPLEADVAVLIGFTHAIIGAIFDGRQTLGKGAATRSVAIARGRQAESLVRPYVIVQQGLRTPTGPFSENCFIIGIRGSGCGWRSTRRPTRPMVSSSAAR